MRSAQRAIPHHGAKPLALVTLAAVATCAGVPGCGAGRATETADETAPPGGAHDDPNFSREKVLSTIAERVVETYGDFDAAATALVRATEAYAASLSPDDLAAAQQSWRDAISLWQQAEIYRFGPAGEVGVTVGGQGLADEIYSWTISTNPCRIDEDTISEVFRDEAALAAEAISVRGLDAIEYLLFEQTGANSCGADLALNTDGSWQSRQGEIPQLRADYAHAAAADVAKNAHALLAAWDPGNGDFSGTFQGAGADGSDFTSIQQAFSAVGDAMLYLDGQTKGRKVGVPSGLAGCTETICPDLVESPFAHYSREHIQNNLTGFGRLFARDSESAAVFGFSDQLRDVGAASAADEIEADLAAAQSSVDSVGGASLTEALSTSLDSVHAAYDALQTLTDRMHTEFVSTLRLTMTSAGPGDAD